ncbi:MAG: prephenate dehydrogenase [Clostridia bacterium]|nr:prephenate dehydrogenase [Clostridia bacterium]
MGMALKYRKSARRVVGYDLNDDILLAAKKAHAIDEGTTELAAAVRDAELIILCTPVDILSEVARCIAPHLGPDSVVTDTGSTKGQVVREMETILPLSSFIGGHPMAGSEKTGVHASDRYLFENAIYVLTPTKNSSSGALEKVEGLVKALGAQKMLLDPQVHDMVVAAVSHVPHITAAALMLTLEQLQETYPNAPTLAAGGFRDTTRIAAGDPNLWEQICFSNREKIMGMLDVLVKHLGELKSSLKEDDRDTFRKALNRAQEQRLRIPMGLKGVLPSLHELVLIVPDAPGVIGNLGTILGNEGINIIDIEILRVREGEGGTLRLGFKSDEAREAAAGILERDGIHVHKL